MDTRATQPSDMDDRGEQHSAPDVEGRQSGAANMSIELGGHQNNSFVKGPKNGNIDMRNINIINANSTDKRRTVNGNHQEFHGPNLFITKRIPGDCIQHLPFAEKAPFDAYTDESISDCDTTRVQILQDIRDWISDGRDNIFWLKGFAGCGKTTIARTIAREYRSNSHLVATYFFSREEDDVGDLSKFAATIARQICEWYKPFEDSLPEGSRSSSGNVPKRTLGDTWDQLILEPLSKLEINENIQLLIVVDALDEMQKNKKGGQIKDMIKILSRASAMTFDRVRLRILVTSRPEKSIVFDIKTQECVLHHLPVDDDIQSFLKKKLCLESQGRLNDWEMKQLVGKTAGSFLYAAKMVEYLTEGDAFNFQNRLTNILGENRLSKFHPEQHLETIYSSILQSSIPEKSTEDEKRDSCKAIRDLFGQLVVALSPHALDLNSLSRLLRKKSPSEITDRMDHYRAIVDIPEDGSRPLRIHHPHFAEFLFHKRRLVQRLNFYVNPNEAHRSMAENCLEVMSEHLEKNMGRYEDECTSVTAMTNLFLPSELKYACRFWTQHLIRSNFSLSELNFPKIQQFLETHFLHWFEAMSILGLTTKAISAVQDLQSLCDSNTAMKEFLQDANRFALTNRMLAEIAPLQLYTSGLIFSPEGSILRKKYRETHCPYQLRNIGPDWPWEYQTLNSDGRITSLAFSANNGFIVSGHHSPNFRLWDPKTGELLYDADTSGFDPGNSCRPQRSSVAITMDSKLLAFARDRTIILGKVSENRAIWALERQKEQIKSVAFSRDGQLLASSHCDCIVKIWKTDTGQPVHTLVGHRDQVNAVVFSPDSSLLASGSDDQSIILWNPIYGNQVHTLKATAGRVYSLAFSSVHGQKLASGHEESTIKVWDLRNFKPFKSLNDHSNEVLSVTFSPDDRFLASGSKDTSIKLWDTSTWTLSETFKGHHGEVTCVAFSGDSQWVASGSNDCSIKIWNCKASMERLKGTNINYDFDPVQILVFSPSGDCLASGARNGTVNLWNTTTGKLYKTLKTGKNCTRILSMSFSPDPQEQVLAACLGKENVLFWNIHTGDNVPRLQKLLGPKGAQKATAIIFSPVVHLPLLACGYEDGAVRLWNLTTDEPPATLVPHAKRRISSLDFSANGKLLVAGSYDKSLYIWDVAETGELVQRHQINGRFSYIYSVGFSKYDENYRIALTSGDGDIKIWSYKERKMIQVMKGHSAFAWPETTQRSAVSIEDHRWLYFDGKRQLWLPWEYQDPPLALNGNLLAIGGRDGSVCFVDI